MLSKVSPWHAKDDPNTHANAAIAPNFKAARIFMVLGTSNVLTTLHAPAI